MWISGYSYRKLPYAMIAAVKMIPGATLRGSNFVPRMKEVVKFFEVQTADLSDAPLRASALLDAIRRTHLSLYVTFSECCPMLPLQSLSVGVPCLIGPNSHLFEDDEYLCQRLVVPYPDRAELIAGHIEAALAERQQIVERYTRYAPAYNMRARQALREFLEG